MKRNGTRSTGFQPVRPPVVPTGDQPIENPLAARVENPSSATFLPAITDFGPGSPTGGLCYLSDGLPEQYRGKLIFSE